jgi:hypothetical protein
MTTPSDGPISRFEVITSVQRRRRWSAAEKVRLVCANHVAIGPVSPDTSDMPVLQPAKSVCQIGSHDLPRAEVFLSDSLN